MDPSQQLSVKDQNESETSNENQDKDQQEIFLKRLKQSHEFLKSNIQKKVESHKNEIDYYEKMQKFGIFIFDEQEYSLRRKLGKRYFRDIDDIIDFDKPMEVLRSYTIFYMQKGEKQEMFLKKLLQHDKIYCLYKDHLTDDVYQNSCINVKQFGSPWITRVNTYNDMQDNLVLTSLLNYEGIEPLLQGVNKEDLYQAYVVSRQFENLHIPQILLDVATDIFQENKIE